METRCLVVIWRVYSLWIIKNIQMQNIGGKSLEFPTLFWPRIGYIYRALIFLEHLSCWRDTWTWHTQHTQCDMHDATHSTCMMWCMWCTHTQHMQCGIVHRVMCVCCASRWQGRCSGKISVPENVTYSGPEKCWKFLNILITSLAQNILGIVYIFWTFSILEYLWNSLNIPGIFPQYSAFEYFLLSII